MKRGFTLIELLAVIVILAIISLMAIPIVVKIINDSKVESQKRSIDHYAKALEQSIEKYLLKKPNEKTNLIERLHDKNQINYNGDRVICDIEFINDDGSIYLENCKVDGEEVKDYTYGKDKRAAVVRLLLKSNSIEITNYTDGNTHEMYTFNHEVTDQTPALTDYRYIGDDPYNYVEFNNETWRIIGIFETETEDGKKDKRIKLIRNEKVDDMYWSSSGIDWVTSSLNIYLNNEYLNTLDTKSKSMIENVKFYLGASERNYELTAKDYYDFERSNLAYRTNSLNTYNKISLIYSSDYVYTFANGVDNKCYNHAFTCIEVKPSVPAALRVAYYVGGSKYFWVNTGEAFPNKSWVYNIIINNNNNTWTISTDLTELRNGHVNFFDISKQGPVYNNSQCCGNDSNNKYAINPVLYLKSNVKIVSGDGTENNPYKLGI